MAKHYLKKKLLIYASALFLSSYLSKASANNTELWSLVYDNPALLNTIKNQQIVIGTTASPVQATYRGTFEGQYGTAHTFFNVILPYFRFANRLTDRSVASFEVATLDFDSGWFPNTFIRNAGTEAEISALETSTKYSYKITDKLSLGAGLDVWFFRGSITGAYVPQVGYYQNKLNSGSWLFGGNLGLAYVLTPTTFLDVSYFSRILARSHGNSTAGVLLNDQLTNKPFALRPDTEIVELVKIFPPHWTVGGKLAYSQWRPVAKYIHYYNTAFGDVVIPFLAHNTWFASVFSKYMINNCWSAVGALSYDGAITPSVVQLGFPLGPIYSATAGPSYTFSHSRITFNVLLGYSYVPNQVRLSNATGKMTYSAPFLNTNLTIDL